jgi:hypothetical protein
MRNLYPEACAKPSTRKHDVASRAICLNYVPLLPNTVTEVLHRIRMKFHNVRIVKDADRIELSRSRLTSAGTKRLMLRRIPRQCSSDKLASQNAQYHRPHAPLVARSPKRETSYREKIVGVFHIYHFSPDAHYVTQLKITKPTLITRRAMSAIHPRTQPAADTALVPPSNRRTVIVVLHPPCPHGSRLTTRSYCSRHLLYWKAQYLELRPLEDPY